MAQGVTLRDPARFDLRGEVSVGRDVLIDVNVVLEGRVVIEDDVQIGPNCVIRTVPCAVARSSRPTPISRGRDGRAPIAGLSPGCDPAVCWAPRRMWATSSR